MPELPEVQTTVDGLNKRVLGLTIEDVETSYKSNYYLHKDEIKNPHFFKTFKDKVVGQKIIKAERRAKNILIHLSNQHTILVHMKMTGFFFYNPPQEERFIRLAFSLNNGAKLAFSDLRKFAKITLFQTKDMEDTKHLRNIGPEPLDPNFGLKEFKEAVLKKPKGKIKQVLMNSEVIAGIGNIYSDEILWRANVHPLSRPEKIPEPNWKLMFKAMKETLLQGINFGGDSMSDYRNIDGKKGRFQENHRAYLMHKKKCLKRGCAGVLQKQSVGGRSAHFCPIHQKLYV